ncbi:MAG: glycosyltransferase family 1 protein [Planctomycetes bacterium]|nr:glycosyltransferase family 1 protein [Planctomycetota bacterium]
MDYPIPGIKRAPVCSWEVESERLEALAGRGNLQDTLDALENLLGDHPASTEAYLIGGRILTRFGEFRTAFQMFAAAAGMAACGTLGESHPDTPYLVTAQLGLDEEDLRIQPRLARNLGANLEALESIEPELARRISLSQDPENRRIIDLWGELIVADPRTGKFAATSEKFTEEVKYDVKTGIPVAFCGVGSCQEILKALRLAPIGFLGETLPIYLFEKNLERLKLLFRLADLSGLIRERRLIIFGGPDWSKSMQRTFSTLRFPAPGNYLGDKRPYQPEFDRIRASIDISPGEKEEVLRYYAGDAFKNRLREIAAGRELPRVLIISILWTTVIRDMGARFEKGFRELGCETHTIIEETKVEELSDGFFLRSIGRFKPDLAFCVSYARPSYKALPDQLPFLCFSMDDMGPVLQLPRLVEQIRPADIFFCMGRFLKKQFAARGIPPFQLSEMIPPADPEVFHPLPPDDPMVKKFSADVAFMKHNWCDLDQNLKDFIRWYISDPKNPPFQRVLQEIVRKMHELVLADRGRVIFAEEFLEMAFSMLPRGGLPPEWEARLRTVVMEYMAWVYNYSFKYYFLEAVARADLKLRLYGNRWERHSALSAFAGGLLANGEELNAAFNGAAISLHIHAGSTMHQRVVEGAQAGAFFLVKRLDGEKDHLRLTDCFEEDREVVFFDSAADLVEKCRHYLERGDERRAIAQRMCERARREHSVRSAAGHMLEVYRGHLKRLLG